MMLRSVSLTYQKGERLGMEEEAYSPPPLSPSKKSEPDGVSWFTAMHSAEVAEKLALGCGIWPDVCGELSEQKGRK